MCLSAHNRIVYNIKYLETTQKDFIEIVAIF